MIQYIENVFTERLLCKSLLFVMIKLRFDGVFQPLWTTVTS